MADISALTAESNPEDRRQYPRRRMLPALSLVDLGDDNGGLILDLSEGGLAVQAIGPLAPNSVVPLSFHLPNVPTPIEGKAEVSWVTDSKMAGIRFLDTPAASQEYIRQWLASNTEAVPAPPEFEINAAASPLIDPGQTTLLGSWQAPPIPPVLEKAEVTTKPAEDVSWVDELPTLAPSEFEDLEMLAPVPDTPVPVAVDSETAPALPAIAALAQSLTRADGIAIAIKAPGGFVCRASKGSAPVVGERIETTAALYAELVRTGLPVSTGDAEREQKLDPVVRRRFDIRSLQAVPLFRRGLMVGIFQISAHRPMAFDATHIATLQRIGDLVITAAQDELDELSSALPAVPAVATVSSFEVQPPPIQAISPAAKRHMMYERELQERRFALWLWEIGAAPAGSYQTRRPRLQNRTAQPLAVSAPAPIATTKQPSFIPVTDDGMHTVRIFNPADAQVTPKAKPATPPPAPKPQTPSDRVRILPTDYSKLN